MKPFIIAASATIISITSTNALGIISGCLEATELTTPILNGTRITTTYPYVSPNCVDMCPCSLLGTTYRCNCNTGYYAVNQNTATCSCAQCPVANSTCSSATSFSCNKGYYKNGNACTRCPSSGGVYGTTASSGATSITSCYLPSGTSGSDSTGSFTYTSNCYYTN